MFCKKCGTQVKEGAVFCSKCGCKITQVEDKKATVSDTKKGQFDERNDNKKKIITMLAIVVGVIVCIVVVVFFALPKGDSSLAGGETFVTETETESANAEYLSAYYNDTILKATPELNVGYRSIVYTYGGIGLVNDAPSMTAGVVGHKIIDLDKDAADELITIYSDGAQYYATVYEIENEVVVKKSETRIGYVSSFPSFSTDNILLVDVGSKKYILYTRQESGALADGYSAEVSMWNYNGTNIVPVMDIIQTEGGSTDFEYTARHYDAAENIIESNVFYREASWDETMRISDEDGSTMASQFSRYGITIKPNMSMFEQLENMLADSMKQEQLYRLDMWVSQEPGSFNDNTQITVYFNDVNKEANMAYDHYKSSLYYKLENLFYDQYRAEIIEYCYYDMNDDGWDEMVVREPGSDDFEYLTSYYIYAWVDGNVACVAEGLDGAWGEYYPTEKGYYEAIHKSEPSSYMTWDQEASYNFNGVGFDVAASYYCEDVGDPETETSTVTSSTQIFKEGVLIDVDYEEYKSMVPSEITNVTWHNLTNLDNVELPEKL